MFYSLQVIYKGLLSIRKRIVQKLNVKETAQLHRIKEKKKKHRTKEDTELCGKKKKKKSRKLHSASDNFMRNKIFLH